MSSEIPSASDVQAVQEKVAAAGVEEVPAAAVKKAAPPARPAPRPEVSKRMMPMPESWSSAAFGFAYWETLVWKGKQYLRNDDDELWLKGEDGGCGEWAGIFKRMEGWPGWYIDDSVPEPVWED